MLEKSLILIKHDGIARNLIGKIITRLEETGLKLVAMKMIWANEDLAKNHYKVDEEWARNVFEKSKTTAEKEGRNFDYKNPMDFATTLQGWNVNFLREGPVIAIVIEGPSAIEVTRKIVGSTEPKQSPPGTIRGDLAMVESYQIANAKKRVLRNLIHASDSPENAKHEINLWFKKEEIHNYKKELDKHF